MQREQRANNSEYNITCHRWTAN